MSHGTMSFVVSDGPKLQADPDLRRLIRKHAMKNVALTRKIRCDSARTKRKQLEDLITAPSEAVESSMLFSHHEDEKISFHDLSWFVTSIDSPQKTFVHSQPQTRSHESTWDLPFLPTPIPFPSTPYELVRSRFNIDLDDLSMLTNFNIGMGTISMISADPRRLISLLGHSKWSYLQFVPSRYGSSSCLTAAADCLLAQVAGIVMPHQRNPLKELKLHVIALRALQEALNDSTSCLSSEALCASQLLSLHALLNSEQRTAWSKYHRGSIHLIKHRTPSRFQSEFDKALYLSHIGPITFDSLLAHTPCYLGEPEWMEIYRSLVCETDTLSERSPLTISLRSQMMLLPDLWHDIENMINGEELFNPQAIHSLKIRTEYMHSRMLGWVEEFNARCIEMALKLPSKQELVMRRELYGTALECLAVVKRLLAAVDIENTRYLEKEVQNLAQSILDLHSQPSPSHSWIFTAHESGVVKSLLMTKEDWIEPGSYSCTYQENLALRRRYVKWTEIIRG